MQGIGRRVAETGMLLIEDGRPMLRRDLGGRYELEIGDVPVAELPLRIRVVGTLVAQGTVNVISWQRD